MISVYHDTMNDLNKTSDLKQRLETDLRQALKKQDKVRLETLRFLMSAIKNAEIDQGSLDDNKIISLIDKQTKQIQEVLADFRRAGQKDRVQTEEEKATILSEYLPKALSTDELQRIVKQVVADVTDAQPQMGQVMSQVMTKLKQTGQRFEGQKVAQLVKSLLDSR